MKIKIITSNIRFANTDDGIHSWESRKHLLADIYRQFGPDILGTQEGRMLQLKELDEAISELILVDQHRSWIDERMYPCLFVNPETINVERSGDIWLSETPAIAGSSSFQSTFPRLCTWAEITFKSSGLQLLIINTHLDHVLSSTREKQIEVLISEVRKISSRPMIIMGDFNESPLTSIKQNLMSAFSLKDPWVEKKLPEETSHHNFKGAEAISGERIDWILIPENFKCETIRMEKYVSSKGVYPSDHYPLLATVIPK